VVALELPFKMFAIDCPMFVLFDCFNIGNAGKGGRRLREREGKISQILLKHKW